MSERLRHSIPNGELEGVVSELVLGFDLASDEQRQPDEEVIGRLRFLQNVGPLDPRVSEMAEGALKNNTSFRSAKYLVRLVAVHKAAKERARALSDIIRDNQYPVTARYMAIGALPELLDDLGELAKLRPHLNEDRLVAKLESALADLDMSPPDDRSFLTRSLEKIEEIQAAAEPGGMPWLSKLADIGFFYQVRNQAPSESLLSSMRNYLPSSGLNSPQRNAAIEHLRYLELSSVNGLSDL